MALSLLVGPISLAVPIRSLSQSFSHAALRITPDAGPEGIGVVIYDTHDRVLGFCKYRLPFQAIDSKFQNIREFLGLVLGAFLAFQFRSGDSFSIAWTNDNTSALSWTRKNMARSRAAQISFLIWTWLGIKAKITLAETVHIPGVTMGDVDALSRFRDTVNLNHELDSSARLPVADIDNLFRLADSTDDSGNLHPWELTIPVVINFVELCLARW